MCLYLSVCLRVSVRACVCVCVRPCVYVCESGCARAPGTKGKGVLKVACVGRMHERAGFWHRLS